ncbi:MAG TPA: hypothetical protein VI055_06360 [Rubrobacter sp.]
MERPAQLGASLSREISEEEYQRGERGERDIDSFICRVHLTRQERQEEERRIVEEWQRSCEREAQERREALRYQWSAYHQCMARRMRRNLEEIVGYHERKAQEYARVPRGA